MGSPGTTVASATYMGPRAPAGVATDGSVDDVDELVRGAIVGRFPESLSGSVPTADVVDQCPEFAWLERRLAAVRDQKPRS
jgi:hypothetical protein